MAFDLPGYPIQRAAPIRMATTMTSAAAAIAAGYAFFICVSVSGTVVCTLESGNTITITPAVGDNIYPFAVTTFTNVGATVTRAYSLS